MLALLSHSCMQRKPEPEVEYIIELEATVLREGKLFLEDFTREILIVPLETRPECMISRGIRQIAMIPAGILVLDRESNLYLFDTSGKYLRNLGQSGKGPGEYIGIAAFSWSEEHKLIFVLDNQGRKLIAFDPEGGQGSPLFNTGYGFNMASLDQRIYLYMPPELTGMETDTVYMLREYETSGVPGNSFLQVVRPAMMPYITSGKFWHYGSGLRFREPFGDTIYHLDQSGLRPVYLLRQGGLRLERQDMAMPEIYREKRKHSAEFTGFVETQKYLFARCLLRGTDCLLIYSKSSGDGFVAKVPGLGSGLMSTHLPGILLNPIFANDSLIILPLEPEDYMKSVQPGPADTSGINHQAGSSIQPGNPVLVLGRLK